MMEDIFLYFHMFSLWSLEVSIHNIHVVFGVVACLHLDDLPRWTFSVPTSRTTTKLHVDNCDKFFHAALYHFVHRVHITCHKQDKYLSRQNSVVQNQCIIAVWIELIFVFASPLPIVMLLTIRTTPMAFATATSSSPICGLANTWSVILRNIAGGPFALG